MALRINTNVAALNAHNQLKNTDSALSKSMEKLSSGYRINHASDDAAGMVIANRLRADTKSLTVASRNTTEARAMLTIAEGATTQVENILERMKELATQSASDNVSDTDRGKIQSEFTQLTGEIDRIVADTKYQGSTLVNGSFGATITSSNTNAYVAADVTLSGATAGNYTLAASGTTASLSNASVTQVIDFAANGTLNFSALGISITTVNDTTTAFGGTTITVGGSGGTYQVGSGNVAAQDQISVTLGDLRAATLGVDAGNMNLNSKAAAQDALTDLDTAINSVGTVVGNIGAYMNRLDYAYSSIQVTIENESASQSVIRDADMAGEMVSFTKSQILLQAGTAMLAQANTSSQSILSLMQ